MKQLAITLAALCIMGCHNTIHTPDVDPSARTNGTFVVCVGVENGYAGKCDGSLKDCENMSKLLKPYATQIVTLKDKQATRAAVRTAMEKGVEYPLFIFYYSGHGGASKSYTSSEEDGQDEYLCLYDGGMLDDDVWDIISSSDGRVFLIFDCCHSGSMFQSPMAFKSQLKLLMATSVQDGPINMLCWSGCPDNTYSYGDKDGGELTKTLLKYFKSSLTYEELWKKIEKDKDLKDFEIVQRTIMGENFGGRRVFQ